jgi:uncharacterized protein YkwD
MKEFNMQSLDTLHRKLPALLVAALLTACGGGGGGGGSTTPDTQPPLTTPVSTCVTSPPGLPAATGDTSVDGFNWFNYRRTGIGLATLKCNQLLNVAAAGHSNYLRLNNTVSHDQVSGNPGFTGKDPGERIRNAGYVLGGSWAYGEVISAAGDKSGFYHAEELIAAIYHRFIIFEPQFREMGTGSSTRSDGYTYFTADMTYSNGAGAGLGVGKVVVYPADRQTLVPTSFDSDTESPDPVPNQNTVGYPISVHADIGTSGIVVNSFTVRPNNGTNMLTRSVSTADEGGGVPHAVAIIPLTPLTSNTIYNVSFNGTVDGLPVSKNWSFTTK